MRVRGTFRNWLSTTVATAVTATSVAVIAPVGPMVGIAQAAGPYNPDLPSSCGVDVTLILDESGSISGYGNGLPQGQGNVEPLVEDAVKALVTAFLNTDTHMQITEFSSAGRRASLGGNTGYQPVDAGFQTLVNNYLAPAGNAGPSVTDPASYNPSRSNDADSIRGTNWEAGLQATVNSPGILGRPERPNLVIFMTDGVPNRWLDGSGNVVEGATDTAVAEAEGPMRALQAVAGTTTHVLGVGVGAAGVTANFNRILNLVEPGGQQVPPGDLNASNIGQTDAVNVGEQFDKLAAAFRGIVYALCAPQVKVTKVDQDGAPVDPWGFEGRVDVAHQAPLTDQYQWRNPNVGVVADNGSGGDVWQPLATTGGTASFEWVPGSVASPQPWDSTFRFRETQSAEYRLAPDQAPQCEVSRLTAAGQITALAADLKVTTNPDGNDPDVVEFWLANPGTSTEFKITRADVVECTIKNVRLGSIEIRKDAVPDHIQDFTFSSARTSGAGPNLLPAALPTLDDDGNAGNGTSNTTGAIAVWPGTYTVTETAIPADWNLTGVAGNCQRDGDTATITVAPGQAAVCTFTNTGSALLELKKVWSGDSAGASATLTAGPGGSLINHPAPAPAATTSTQVRIPIGQGISIAETGVDPNEYSSTLSCSGNTQVSGNTGTAATVTADTVGELLSCTFTNTRIVPAVSVRKQVTAGPTQQPGTNLYDLTYTITVENTSTAAGTFQLADVLELPTGTATIGTITTQPGTVALTPGWNGTGTLAPTQPIPGKSTVTITIPVTVTLPGTAVIDADCANSQTPGRVALNEVTLVGSTSDNPADNSTCTELPPPNIAHTKVVSSATRDASGLWTVVYEVVVSNTGDGPGVYDLADEFSFGGGVTIVGTPTVAVTSTDQTLPPPPSAANPSFTGTAPNTSLVDDQQIVAGATHTYTITVKATVTDPTPAPNAGACSTAQPPAAGGFLNVATLITPGKPDTAKDACAPFGTLTLKKVVQGGPASPADFTLTATGAANASPATFSGTSGVTNDVMPGIEYTLSESFTVDGYAQSGDWVCTGATVTGGNKVTVPNGGDVTCTVTNVYTPPNVAVSKQVVSGPTQVPNTNRYDITYEITVTNGSATAGQFDLTDVLTFPPASGITLFDVGTLTATGVAAGDLNQAWNGTGNLLVGAATPHAIPGNSTVTITVPVTVTLPGAAATAGACTDDDGRTRSVLNQVTLTGTAADANDATCTELPNPNLSITKVAGEPVAPAPGDDEWTITYTIAVANTGTPTPGPGAYDLDDELDFGAGVIVSDVTSALVSAGGQTSPAVPGATNPDFDGASNIRIASNVTIVGGVTHTYSVTVTFTIDASAVVPPSGDTPGSLECGVTDNTPSGAPGQATYNLATISHPVTHTTIDEADACKPLPLAEVSKTGPAVATWVSGTTFTAAYTVTARNTGGTPVAVTVTDVPSIGITGASITGVSVDGDPVVGYVDGDTVDLVAGTLLAGTGTLTAPIPIGGSEPYAVVVTFTVPASTSAGDRACAPGNDLDHGVHNGAAITFPGGTDDDAVCTDIPAPAVTVDKHHTGAPAVSWDAAGELTAVYSIDVTNGGAATGAYTLTDDLAFPDWVTVTGVSVASVDGSPLAAVTHTDSNDQTVTLSDANVAIDPAATHTYTVTITFTAEATATNSGAACQPGTPGNGLFNTARVGAALSQSDDDCIDIPRAHLVVQKTTVGGDGTFPFVSSAPLFRSDTAAAATVITTSSGTGQWTLGAWVTPGTYTVTETVPGDWVQVAPVPAAAQAAAPDSPATWHFTNALLGEVTVTKRVTSMTGDGAWSFGFAISPAATLGSPDASISGSGESTSADSVKWTGLLPGVEYTITEVLPAGGWSAGQISCSTNGGDPMSMSGAATFTVAGGDSVECTFDNAQHPADLVIEKSHSNIPDGDDSVEVGEVFDWVITVDNVGQGPALNAVVSDTIPARLEIAGTPTVTPVGSASVSGNTVTVTLGTVNPADPVITITVPVRLLPAGAEPQDSVTNTACVVATELPEECDDDTVLIDDIVASAEVVCRNEAYYLVYEVATSASLAGQPISLVWTPNTPGASPAQVTLSNVEPGVVHELPWPGTGFTPGGISVDWPGWRPIVESDYDNGVLKETDPAKVFNGMIFDGAEPDAAWAAGSTVTFSVNPSVSVSVSYPLTVPDECLVDRNTQLTIDKSVAGGTTYTAGDQVTYNLNVVNTSVDAAAGNVVLTDVIPVTERVDSISTSATAFPRWTNCAVAGENAAGYGGTLTCTLFGPLAAGAAAPAVTLVVTIDPATQVSSITNIGVVQWSLFDDPSETGEASDPAEITVVAQAPPPPPAPLPPPPPAPLPATGSSLVARVVPLGAALIGLGLVVSLGARRRKHTTAG